MSGRDAADERAGQDRRLVKMIDAVLVDPDLHTDTRMRLHQEIMELLRATHVQMYGPSGHEVHHRMREAHGDHLPSLLQAVLVDPNLHTDARMRLHREIEERLGARHTTAFGRREEPE
jgi:hypothetical protein